MTAKPPSRAAFAAARFRYEKTRLRAHWRLLTRRCPACPKTPRGPHKFGCNRPSAPMSMRAIRKQQ